ncbi:MAG TPA: hypothetical protein VFQ65_10525 [Kofleriaceae bacterium]|nr:hypothetical protein [Kofleriaceae bacterium]
MRFAELPKVGLLCDLALAGVLVALLARPGSPQMQVIRQVDTEVQTTPCTTIGNVEFIGERTIVTLPEPLRDGRCHSHVREYRGDVGPDHLVREYDRF